jgi:hypothetical protein
MKTVETLKEMITTVDGKVRDTIQISNPCQMWKNVDAKFEEFGNGATVTVNRVDGTAFKIFTMKQTKSGKYIKINAVKETNRGMMNKAKAAAKAAAEKLEAKRAKRREYDRKRRAAKRLQKAEA